MQTFKPKRKGRPYSAVSCWSSILKTQEFCDWAFAKDFDLEDDIDSQAGEDEEEG